MHAMVSTYNDLGDAILKDGDSHACSRVLSVEPSGC